MRDPPQRLAPFASSGAACRGLPKLDGNSGERRIPTIVEDRDDFNRSFRLAD